MIPVNWSSYSAYVDSSNTTTVDGFSSNTPSPRWAYSSTNPSFTQEMNATTYRSTPYSWQTTWSSTDNVNGGDVSQISASVVATATSGSISVWIADNHWWVWWAPYTLWHKQVVFNGNVCYSADLDDDGTDWVNAVCSVTGLTVGQYYPLVVRLWTRYTGSESFWFPVTTMNVDDLSLTGLALVTPSGVDNIGVFDSSGNSLYAWMENGASSLSTASDVWVKLGSAGIPAGGSTTIILGFYPKDTDGFLLDGYWGEAPQLSPTYGLYDNGASVFNFYDSFSGTALNDTEWTVSRSSYTVNDGLTVSTDCNLETLSESALLQAPYVIDYYGAGLGSGYDGGMFFALPSNPTGGSSVDGNLFAQRGSGSSDQLYYYTGGSFTAVDSWASSADGSNHVYSLASATGNNPLFTMRDYATSETYADTGMGTYVNGYYGPRGPCSGSSFWQWTRARAYLPGNIMPPSHFGSVQGSGTSFVTVTVASSPFESGYVTLDGTEITAPQNFTWTIGSTHTIAASSPVTCGSGCQYIFSAWSDSGVQAHNVTASPATTDYTATFQRQYYLTMSADNGGTVSPSSGWQNASSMVQIQASPSTNYAFSAWTGSGTSSYSGTDSPTQFTMDGPVTESAAFITATLGAFSSLVAYVPITISNAHSSPVSGGAQVIVAVNWSTYGSYLDSSLDNVGFFDNNLQPLNAWVESGANSTATTSSVWVKLNAVGIPASGSTTMYLGFYQKRINDFSPTGHWGEAPTLSSTYGKYDNGAQVFDLYANFQGTAMPASWITEGTGSDSAQFVGGTGNDGGVYMPTSGWYGWSSILIYTRPFNKANQVFEVSGRTQPGCVGNCIYSGVGIGFYADTTYQMGTAFSLPPFNAPPGTGYYAYYERSHYSCSGSSPPCEVLYSDGSQAATNDIAVDYSDSFFYLQTVAYSTSVTMNYASSPTESQLAYQAGPVSGLTTLLGPYATTVSNAKTMFYVGTAANGAQIFDNYWVYWVRSRATLPGNLMPSSSFGNVRTITQSFVNVTVTSTPTGSGYVLVDGTPITTPRTYSWAIGASHTISASSSASNGYRWQAWSDSESISHQITIPLAATTYTATFTALNTASIVAYVPVTLTNTQSSPVTGGSQVMVTVNWSTYSNDLDPNLDNVRVFDSLFDPLYAWVETNAINTAASSNLWVKLNSEGIPASGSTTIYIGFYMTGTNNFSPNGYWGEAPTLSSTYGQYDNGAQVFDLYANFQGSSMPANWIAEGVSGGSPNSAQFIGGTGATGGVILPTSGWWGWSSELVYTLPYTEANRVFEVSGRAQPGCNGSCFDSGVGIGFYANTTEPFGTAFSLPPWNAPPGTGYYAYYERSHYTCSDSPPNLLPCQILYSDGSQAATNGIAVDYGDDFIYLQTVASSTSVTMNYASSPAGSQLAYQAGPVSGLTTLLGPYSTTVSNTENVFYVGAAANGAQIFDNYWVYWVRSRATLPGNMMPTAQFGNGVYPNNVPVIMTVSYLSGGGSGYSPPSFSYVEGGQPMLSVLSTSPTVFAVDSGSTWSVSPNPLAGSTPYELWSSNDTLTGTASDGTYNFTFYHNLIPHPQVVFNISGVGSDAHGTLMRIDGVNYTRSQFPLPFYWAPMSVHSVWAVSPVSASAPDYNYLFVSWSINADGLSCSDGNYVTASVPETVTANFVLAAGESSGTGTVCVTTTAVPRVVSIQIDNYPGVGANNTAVDVDTWYLVKVSVNDTDQLTNLQRLEVRLYQTSTGWTPFMDPERRQGVAWDYNGTRQSLGASGWRTPDAYFDLTGSSIPSLNSTGGVFVFKVKLHLLSHYTQDGGWSVMVFLTDKSNAVGYENMAFDVNLHVSLTITTSMRWSAQAGQSYVEAASMPFVAQYTANAVVKLQVNATDPTSQYGDSFAVGNLLVSGQADHAGPHTRALTGSLADWYPGLGVADGASVNAYWFVSVPTGQPTGTYTFNYDMNIAFDQYAT
jgi:hypothetical protein